VTAAGKALALFDFDGTLTRKDTFFRFHLFSRGPFRLLSACAALLGRACRALRFDRNFLKAAMMERLWKNVPRGEYEEAARRFALSRVEGLLRPVAFGVFLRHVERGHDVCVVTASMKDWIAPWASKYGVPVIGTELETMEGRLTGRLSTPNCWGPEKTARIEQALDLKKYDKIYAYGDSRGDAEMLALADEKIYRWDHVPADLGPLTPRKRCTLFAK
jgi:HAD superfamily hydrolase (TIGR01490 family)